MRNDNALIKNADTKKTPNFWGKLKEIWGFFSRYLAGEYRAVFIICSAIFAVGLFNMVGGWVSGETVNFLTEGSDWAYYILIGFSIFWCLKFWLRSWLQERRFLLFNGVIKRAANSIYERVLRTKLGLFHKFRTEDILSRLGEITSLPSLIEDGFQFLLIFVQWVFVVIYCCAAHWGFVVIIATEVVLLAFVSGVTIPVLIRETNRYKDYEADLGQRRRESLAKIIETKINGSLVKTIGKVVDLNYICQSQQEHIAHINIKLMIVSSWIDEIKSLAIKLLAAYLILSGEKEVGFMVTMVAYSTTFESFTDHFIGFVFGTVPDTYNSVQRLKQLEEVDIDEFGTISKDKIDELKVSNLSFAYDGKKKDVLSNINLSLKKGQVGALVGESGCGKSTLASLLCGLNHPQKGSIEFDGVNLNDIDYESRSSLVGMVKQSNELYEGTIRSQFEHVRNYSEENMIKACKIAKIHDFIMDLKEESAAPVKEQWSSLELLGKAVLFIGRLIKSTVVVKINPTYKNRKRFVALSRFGYKEILAQVTGETEEKVVSATGYDCSVKEHARNFSGGQIQRLALAIVLMQNPEIIILDEATSAQDPMKQKAIFDDIYPMFRDKIVIIIAHRLSTVARANKIFMIENHEIIGSGTLKDLYNNCNSFKEFVDAETGGLEIAK